MSLALKAGGHQITRPQVCKEVFKQILCTSPILFRPLVQVDASSVETGAVLAQGKEGLLMPVLKPNRKLLPRVTQDSTITKAVSGQC